MVTPDGTARFGLLAKDGTVQYFEAPPSALLNISMETFNLARMSRFVARTGRSEGFISSGLYGATPRAEDGMFAPFDGCRLKFMRAVEHQERLQHLMEDYAA